MICITTHYIVWKIHFQRMNQFMKSRPKNLIKSNKSISRFFYKKFTFQNSLKNSMRVTRTIIRIIFNMVKIHFSFPVINFLFHSLWMYYWKWVCSNTYCDIEWVCGFTEWLFCKTTYLLTWIWKGIWFYILVGYVVLQGIW